MPNLTQILERKSQMSGQVSAQTRALALGMLAISWALLTPTYDPLKTMAAHVSRTQLLALAVLAVLVIALDLLQYVAATNVADEAASRAENDPSREALYDNTRFAYKAQVFLYSAKFWLLAAAAVLLAIIFIQLFRVPVG